MARLLVLSLGFCFVVLYPVASRHVDVRSAQQMLHKTVKSVETAKAWVPRERLSLLTRRPSAALAAAAAADARLTVASVPPQPSPVSRNSRRKSPGRTRDYKLPAGTVLSVQLRTPLGSGLSRVDEPVTAELRQSISRDGVELIPAGSVMFGKVAELTSATARDPLGRLVLAFHVIEHAETGHRAMIASRLVAFEAAVPEVADGAPRRRKAKKEPIDVELPPGHRFTVTLGEPLLIRIPG